jgi:hypothetical protein
LRSEKASPHYCSIIQTEGNFHNTNQAMLRSFFFPALIALAATFTLTNCRTAQKYIENGDYDGAVEHCVDKLSGRKKKSDKLVRGLELAFQKATERDMRTAEALAAENQPANWSRINDIHQNIQDRQASVAPLLPLKSKDGYEAKFLFVNIEKLELESRTKAAEYAYQKALDKMDVARKGDKAAARAAYHEFTDIRRNYFRDFKDTEKLQREAERLGIVYVLFKIENNAHKILPQDFERKLLGWGTNDLDSKWRRFDMERDANIDYDYKAVFHLDDVDISPERYFERTYTDETTITTYEYEYDAKGNVKKDKYGNDIKKEVNTIVQAHVIEVRQAKEAHVRATVEMFDTDTKQRVSSEPLAATILFEHYASTFKGDDRALSQESRCRIGSQPVPFPFDSDMLAQAAERMKPTLSNELERSIRLR